MKKTRIVKMLLLLTNSFPLFSYKPGDNSLPYSEFYSLQSLYIDDGKDNITWDLYFSCEISSYHTLQWAILSPFTQSNPSSCNDPYKKNEHVQDMIGGKELYVYYFGSDKVTVEIPRKYIGNTNTITFYDTYYPAVPGRDGRRTSWSFTLKPISAKSFTLKNNNDITLGEGYSAYLVNGVPTTKGVTLKSKGMNEELYSFNGRNFPFDQIGFKQLSEIGREIEFSPDRIALRIYSHLDDYEAFNSIYSNGRKWREAALETYKGSDSYYHFRLKSFYGVSIDGRRMCSIENMSSGARLTKDIFLPPIKAGEQKQIDCEIIFYNCLPGKKATISYPFSLTVEDNYFGSCYTSKYCLEVS